MLPTPAKKKKKKKSQSGVHLCVMLAYAEDFPELHLSVK